MSGDIDASRDPDLVVALHVVEEPLERGDPSRATHQSTVQPDREHLRCARYSLRVQDVEGVAQVREELLAAAARMEKEDDVRMLPPAPADMGKP